WLLDPAALLSAPAAAGICNPLRPDLSRPRDVWRAVRGVLRTAAFTDVLRAARGTALRIHALARCLRERRVSTAAVAVRAAPLRTLASTDHKRIATSAVTIAFGFFLAGGVLALLMRAQLTADGGVISQDTYN